MKFFFIENAFFSWLSDIAPKAAIGGVLLWVLMRWAVRYGNYEARFTRIESNLEELKVKVETLTSTVNTIDVRLTRLEGRMDGLESQMKIIIELLKGKNIA